jgi:uncharacterized SAM-binding protein YcdF (DUF218 family)
MTSREELLALVFTQPLKKADAIVVLEGDGRNRLKKAFELYKNKWSKTILFSGGIDNPKSGSFVFAKLTSAFIKYQIPKKNILIENLSQNTREQAVEVMKIVSEKRWKKIIIIASPYHQLRAFLTFLKVMQEKKLQIEIINAPATDLSWFEETPWGRRIDLFGKEYIKIRKYQKMGHLSTYKDGVKYFQNLI